MKLASINREYILNLLVAHQKELQNSGMQQVGLSGSFVRKKTTAESHVCLLIDIAKEKKAIKNFVGLGDFFEHLFQSKLRFLPRKD